MGEDAVQFIVEKRISEITEKATEQIGHIVKSTEREIAKVGPQLKSEIEGLYRLSVMDAIELIRKGGFVRTGTVLFEFDSGYLHLEKNARYSDGEIWEHQYIKKGRYNVTLIVEKLEEEV